MDLEKLNKSQIVLLTLLVSFVTSIATGIVTITLMEQAPPAITQTVNRIVERTVEKVAPAAAVVAGASTVKETVIINESELLANGIAAVSPAVVRLYTPGKDEAGKDIQLFIGLAIVSNSEGVLIADAGTPEGHLTILRTDGTEVAAKTIERPAGAKIIRLQAATTTAKGEKIAWHPATFSSANATLGQTIAAIAGRTATRVAGGIITALSEGNEKERAGMIVETSIAPDDFAAGSPLINTKGEIMGIATRETRAGGSAFLASSEIISYSKRVDSGTATTTP